MKLVDMSLTDFIELLGSGEPAPGGGGGAALNGAVGVALTKMVAEFTVGKKKYAEHEEEVQGIRADCEKYMDQFLKGVDADRDGFNQVAAVYAMPKDTEEEKAARREAMQASLKEAVKPPFETMELAVEALKITKQSIGKTNTNVASDIGVAALSLKSALQSAWLNVLINISGLKDEALVAEYTQKGETLLAEGTQLADEIYQVILEAVK